MGVEQPQMSCDVRCVFVSNDQTPFAGWTEGKATINKAGGQSMVGQTAAARESISRQGSVD